jgi:hypothetical protein
MQELAKSAYPRKEGPTHTLKGALTSSNKFGRRLGKLPARLKYQIRRVRKLFIFKRNSNPTARLLIRTVWPSVRMHETTRNCWIDFKGVWYWIILRKTVEPFHFPLKSDNLKDHFTWGPAAFFSRVIRWMLSERNIFSDTSCREKWIAQFIVAEAPPKEMLNA